jgi:hypothetical protein
MNRVVPTSRAEFLQLQPVLLLLPVLRRRVIAVLTIAALQSNDFAHAQSDWLAAFAASSNSAGLPIARFR